LKRKISDTSTLLKSSNNLKNPNAQEEYRIIRQKRIAQEKAREEAENLEVKEEGEM
jgi:hypothetical protein